MVYVILVQNIKCTGKFCLELCVYLPRARQPSPKSTALQQRLDQLGLLLEHDDLPFGLGDLGLPVTLAWLDALGRVLELGLTLPDTVGSWRARVEAEPPVGAELSVYRPVLDAWLAKTTA